MKKNRMMYYLLAFLLLVAHEHGIGQTAQMIQVAGVVTDQKNEPLTGVTVKVKGALLGAVSDVDGNYRIQASSDAVLVFSYIGFETVEKPVRGNVLNVAMEESIKELDDVVVIGYGEMRKRDLSGAISSVEAKEIEEQTATGIFDALKGLVAGLEIVTGSGAPGEEAVVRVRGTSTFEAGANPLYVVDGVIYDNIDDINPADIESIEVLKDAASAAIYGSRSANGVFLVTTKQGTSETSLNVRYVQSYSSLTRKMPQATSTERRYYEQIKRRISRERLQVSAGGAIVDTLRSFYNQNLDTQDLIFRTARRHDVNLSASGASTGNQFKYYLNAGYLNENGIIVNSRYDRLTFRVNADYSPHHRLTLSSKLSFYYTDKDGISESGVLVQLLQRVPYWAIFNPDGSYVPNVNGRANPLATAMTDIDQTKTYKATLSQSLQYKFSRALTANARVQGNYYNWRYNWYRPSTQLSATGITTGKDNSKLNSNWMYENYLSYAQSFDDEAHRVSGVMGASLQGWENEVINLTGLHYTTDEIYTLNAASGFDAKNTYTRIAQHRMASLFGRASYNYLSRYMFNANLRYDGSSRFGRGNRWGLFPSASVAWRLSSESFHRWMKPVVSDAKLRFSYGITGNESIGDYMSQLLYAPNFVYEDGGQSIAGIGASNLGYDNLGWEETAQYNIGLDLRLMKNRISIVVDYYVKETDRLLSRVQVPKEIGFSTMYKNVGSMTNKGLEFAAKWDVIRKKLKWTLSGNIAANVAKVTKIADGIPFYRGSDDAIYIQEGARIGEFYGYKYIDVFPYDESNAFTPDWQQLTPHFDGDGTFSHYTLNEETYTGEIKQKRSMVQLNSNLPDSDILRGGDMNYEDVNRDGVIDNADKTYLGCAQPDFFGGAATSLSYRGFSFYASLTYSIGGKVYNYAEARRNQNRFDASTPAPHYIRTMWTQPGDKAIYPAPYTYEHNLLAPASLYLEDGSYIKLKTVKLSYNLPKSALKKLNLKAAIVSVYGNNVLTLTDYSGYDPEFGNKDPLTMNIDPNRYPRKREWGFNLNVEF